MRLPGPHAILRLFAAALWAFSTSSPAKADPHPPEPISIQLKWYDQFQFAGYYTAEQLGYYKAKGLNVNLRSGGKGIDPVNEVLSGRAQFGIGDSDLLLVRAKGKPIVVLAAVFQHTPYIILTRGQDHLARPSDFIGKSVMAVDDQGAAQFRAMLLREGVDPKKVTIRPHSWNIQDLVTGKVDGMTAYLTVEPYQLEKLGVAPGILRPSDYGIDFYGDCLFTTEDEIRDHPSEVAGVLSATLAGWKEAMRDPAQVIPWILKRPGVRQRGIGTDNLAYEARAMQPLILSDIVPVGHMNPDRWQKILATYEDLGLAPRSATIEGFLYKPPLTAIPTHMVRWAWMSLLALMAIIVVGLIWITTLRRAVRARTFELHRDQLRLQLAQHSFDQARDFISWVDSEGRYIYANRALLDLYRTTLEEIQTRFIWTQNPSMGRERWDEIWREVMRNGTRLADASLVGVDGRHVPVEVLSTKVKTGAQVVCCHISRDLTESRRAEKERKNRERELRLILESTGVGYWDWDIPTGTLEMDTTVDRMLGYEPYELPRRIGTWTDHLHPEDRDRTFGILQPFLDGDTGVYDVEFRMRLKDGSWLWCNAKGRATELREDGRALRIQGVLQDIEERKQTETSFQQTQRLESLGLLAGGIAHDFNNLLTAVLGNLSLAQLGASADVRATVHIKKAEAAVHKAANLTRQLLAYSGKGRLMVGAIDLNALIFQMKEILTVGLNKDIALEVALAPDPPFIQGDSTQIQQVVLNLITNAAEAIGEAAGTITLKTQVVPLDGQTRFRLPSHGPLPSGDYAVLTVSDTGVGMTPEIQARLFDPFFTTKSTGHGLGLSALVGILRGHQGGIQIESAPGAGTVFRLFFPLHSASTPLPKSIREVPVDELRGDVLLADDEPAVLEAAQSLLEALGFLVHTAEDGESAIACFLEHLDRIRLVLLDQTMPRMSGTDTFRAIRRLRPEVPVILTSGFSEEEIGDVLHAEGLDGFLQKPYRLADLERVVRDVLSRPRA